MSKLIAVIVAAGGAGALAYSQMPELRRYMKIRQM
jgi:hypothetical protein